MGSPRLSLDLQKKVFAALVTAQDAGATRWHSWELVSLEFSIPLADVAEIEVAGMAGRWWPLTYGTLGELIPPMLEWANRSAHSP